MTSFSFGCLNIPDLASQSCSYVSQLEAKPAGATLNVTLTKHVTIVCG
jgi:hypothetical protein